MSVPPQQPGQPGAAPQPGSAAQPAPAGGGQGGLDLSAVRSRSAVPAQAAGQGGAGVSVPALVFDVDEASFNSVVELSARVPVVLDLWADWCEPCKQLSPVLDRVVEGMGGALVLGKVDVDANPRIQQMFQVQSIPTVVAIVQGQPVPLFQGAQPEAQVKQLFDQLVQLAGQQGMTERAVVAGQAEEPAGPAHPDALDALERGDLDGAEAIYREALAAAPADEDAKVGLARVGLLKRTRGKDLGQVRQAAADEPGSVDAALELADLDVAGGHVDDAFARLLGMLPTLAGDDRERVRVRLLELFEVVGAADPRVTKARSRLMRALF